MKIIITTFLILFGLNTMAQSDERINNLFGKKWIITTYEIAGQKFPATDRGKDDCAIFYADNNVKSVERGITTLSKWKYDATNNTMTLYSDNINVTTQMKIFTLTENEFVWETTNPEGMTMTIHMLSSADN